VDEASGGHAVAFVVNAARTRRLTRLRPRLEAAAAAAGWPEPLVLLTTPADSGTGLAAQALAAGATLVVAVGGDGTVRACAQALTGTGVPLAIVPAGTANLAARSLRLPGGVDAALRIALRGRDRPVDVAMADGAASVSMAGIGLAAAVVGSTPGWLKRRTGWLAYAAAAAGPLRSRPAEFSIRLDGGPELVRRARSVVAGNCGLLPGGFVLLPAARLDDGVLDVGILAPRGPAGWASAGYRVVARSGRDDRRLERYQARLVEIRADRPLPRQVDGEMLAPGDALTVVVQAGALLVRVPA
jgi:diacylglycerol kinase family enzyme